MGNLFPRTGWRDVWLGRSTTELRLLMVGLDAVGKTTLLYQFKLGELVLTIPTVGFNVESFTHGHVTFTAWEIGGGDKIRPLWRHYYEGTDAVLFLPRIHSAPLLVLANKQDLPGAMRAEEIAVALEIHKLQTSAVAVLPVVVTDGTGLSQALDWLTLQLTHRTTTKTPTD